MIVAGKLVPYWCFRPSCRLCSGITSNVSRLTMLEARFSDAALFKKIVEAVKDFKEFNLECDGEGMHMKVMDECHVSLAHLYLSSSFFEMYKCDKSCELGLNVETLSKVIRQAPNDLPLVLKKNDDSDRLRFQSDEEPETGLRRAGDMNLITVTGDSLHIPEQKYSAEVEIPTKLYSSIIKDLTGIAEDVRLSVSQKTLKFEADGERGRVENVFFRGQGAFTSTRWDVTLPESGATHIEQSYALRFLTGFSKACPLSDRVTLGLSSGLPLCLRFCISHESFLAFYVAPALD